MSYYMDNLGVDTHTDTGIHTHTQAMTKAKTASGRNYSKYKYIFTFLKKINITKVKKQLTWKTPDPRQPSPPSYQYLSVGKKEISRWSEKNGIMVQLTHLPQVPHICVNELGQHWFRWWFVAFSAPSHYLNQYWVIFNWALRNKLQWNFNQNAKLFIHGNTYEISSAKWQPFCPGGDGLRAGDSSVSD